MFLPQVIKSAHARHQRTLDDEWRSLPVEKRLEHARVARLWRRGGDVIELTMSELRLFLEGCPWIETVSLSPEPFVVETASA